MTVSVLEVTTKARCLFIAVCTVNTENPVSAEKNTKKLSTRPRGFAASLVEELVNHDNRDNDDNIDSG